MGNALQKYISKLERVQKKAIWAITRSKFNVYKSLPVPLLRLYIYIMEIHMTTWRDTAHILKHQQNTQR